MNWFLYILVYMYVDDYLGKLLKLSNYHFSTAGSVLQDKHLGTVLLQHSRKTSMYAQN